MTREGLQCFLSSEYRAEYQKLSIFYKAVFLVKMTVFYSTVLPFIHIHAVHLCAAFCPSPITHTCGPAVRGNLGFSVLPRAHAVKDFLFFGALIYPIIAVAVCEPLLLMLCVFSPQAGSYLKIISEKNYFCQWGFSSYLTVKKHINNKQLEYWKHNISSHHTSKNDALFLSCHTLWWWDASQDWWGNNTNT